MSEDSINVRVEANAAGVSQGMSQATNSVKGAVGQMNAALNELKGSSASATAALIDDMGNKLPVAAVRAHNALQQVGASAGQQRAGLQVLSYQINDVATQFAMGTNPMMIFAQQGSQVVQAIALMRGSVGGFIGFLAGPWGAAILGAVSILGVMISSHQRAADAQDAQTDATKDLTQATRELRDATEREITTTQASIAANIRQAQALRNRAIAARQAALAELELARARIQSAQAYLGSGMPSKGGTEIAGGQLASATADVNRLNAEIARQNQNIARNEQSIRAGRGLQIQQEVLEATDASAAATGRYERRVYSLTQALTAGRITEAQYRDSIAAATAERDRAEAAARSRGGGGGGGRSGGGGGRGGAAARDRMSEWEEALTIQQQGHARLNQQNNTFYAFSKQAEADYWNGILSQQNLSREERIQVEARYLAAAGEIRRDAFDRNINLLNEELGQFQNNHARRLEIATQIAQQMLQAFGQSSNEYLQAYQQVQAIERQRLEQTRQLNSQINEAHRIAALDRVDLEAQANDLAGQLGVISQSQVIEREIEFENQRFQINLQALQERLALMEQDPDMNPVEYQRIKDEILAIEQEHQLRVGQMRNQQVLEGRQAQLTGIRSLSQSWGQTLAEMFVGMKSFSQGVQALWQGLVGAIVQALTQMIAKWIAQKIAAFILGKTLKTTEAAGQITAQAGVAGAAAFASTAAIPIVGPALAPAAAAAASAGALAFLPLAAAEQGYDVPSGLNPITQLHQKEMVLPAEQADVIRNMAKRGDSVTAAGGINININALDGHSVRRVLMDNKSELVSAIKSAVRDGAR
ncbi:MAG: hypothetical protein A4E20_11965 [Nitrospira sp. SG-bin2]|uniref:phage tail length tape measure family protein n=1 Tax=Nitrospira cf. moscoviensis SBR1015 TaxID=96242 RepID=UPI000A0CE160|nr:phage tail length tape measure family protein [Nitrospira cf. moscoviensis SBR1015]OQW33938.1 MAG: hypothetical protein A4E20_11965 [Nitrospira sp. SG-bin2]